MSRNKGKVVSGTVIVDHLSEFAYAVILMILGYKLTEPRVNQESKIKVGSVIRYIGLNRHQNRVLVGLTREAILRTGHLEDFGAHKNSGTNAF